MKYLVVSLLVCLSSAVAGAAVPAASYPYWIQLGPISSATEVGNGGFEISCANSDGTRSHWFYDLFLAKQYSYHDQKAMEFGNLNYADIVDKILRNYALIDKNSSDNLRTHFADFWDKATNLKMDQKSYPFIEVAPGALPFSTAEFTNCSLEQIISNVRRGSIYYYSFKLDRFLQLDELNKAVAVLHELTYHDITIAGWAAHSRAVYSNLFVISLPDLSQASPSALLDFQTKNVLTRKFNAFRSAQYGKYNLIINPVGVRAEYPSDNWTASTTYKISFYENYSRIKEALIQSTRIEVGPLMVTIGGRVKFDLDGNLIQARLLVPTPIWAKIGGRYQKCARTLNFNPTGDVIGCE